MRSVRNCRYAEHAQRQRRDQVAQSAAGLTTDQRPVGTIVQPFAIDRHARPSAAPYRGVGGKVSIMIGVRNSPTALRRTGTRAGTRADDRRAGQQQQRRRMAATAAPSIDAIRPGGRPPQRAAAEHCRQPRPPRALLDLRPVNAPAPDHPGGVAARWAARRLTSTRRRPSRARLGNAAIDSRHAKTNAANTAPSAATASPAPSGETSGASCGNRSLRRRPQLSPHQVRADRVDQPARQPAPGLDHHRYSGSADCSAESRRA